jgi:hypothetical protein
MLTVLFSASIIFSQLGAASSEATRQVCVPQFDPSAGRIDRRAWSGRSHFPEVHVDLGTGEVFTVLPDVTIRAALPIGEKHRVVLSGKKHKIVSEFSFTFEEHGLKDLCLWYNPSHRSWKLSDMVSAPRKYCASCDFGN